MSHKKLFTLLLIVVAILLFDSSTASACSCGQKSTVLDAYDASGFVVMVRAVSVEKGDGKQHVDGVRTTDVVVEKSFKGNLKVGERMTFSQGGGADCIWTFAEEDIGKQFLFYLRPLKEKPSLWFAGTCGRSRNAEYAADDLLYLNNREELLGKSRISGTLSFYQASPLEDVQPIYKKLSGKKVRIIGKTKSYKLITNSEGVYEIYDLPAGSYEIEPEIPVGWKVGFGSQRSRSVSEIKGEESKDNEPRKPQRSNAVAVLLQAGRHAYVDFRYEVSNAIRGRVLDPQGNALNGVCLNLIPAQGARARYFYEGDCTEKEGKFALDDVPPGSYVLIINQDGKISSDEPFPTFYYPNALEGEKAAIITIGEGETIADLIVHAPAMRETISVTGVFLYADGKPVIGGFVEFQPELVVAGIDGNARATIDSQGRFSIKILKGIKGELHGTMYAYVGKFEDCPTIDRAIKQTGSDSGEVKTTPFQLIGDSNQYDVELKYSFKSCKKAKE